MKKCEIVTIAVFTIIFLCFALFNLGSVEIPSSCWLPVEERANVSIEDKIPIVFHFDGIKQVKEAYIFLADKNRTKFDVYAKGEKIASYDNKERVHFCTWNRINLGNTSTRSLRLVFSSSRGEIGEIVVISGHNKKIEVIGVEGVERAKKLIDEQSRVKFPITLKYGAYFDEMYFVRTAQEHMELEEPYEWTHPPLGKLIIAFGIQCFGMNPFGWRILGVLAAAAMIPIMFIWGKKLFGSSMAGFFAAFLLTFEFMHFSSSRLATGEIYILLFSLLMFYFFFDYVSKREGEREKGATLPLFLSTIFFGLCFAVKWTAVFGFLAILFLLLIRNLMDRKPIFSGYRLILGGLFVSAAIYIATYIPYMLSGEGHSILDVLTLQLHMFGYHAAGVKETYETFYWASPWWEWPLMLKPYTISTYPGTFNNTVSTIVLMGNPAIWWCSIPALVLIGAELVRRRAKIRNTWQRKDYVLLFIIISFLLQWLLYALIPRILFIYHFIANVPFMIFALTYWLNELWLNPNHPTPKPLFTKERVIKRVFVLSYLILTALLFFFFYPVISGFPVSYEYKEQLRWLSGWTF